MRLTGDLWAPTLDGVSREFTYGDRFHIDDSTAEWLRRNGIAKDADDLSGDDKHAPTPQPGTVDYDPDDPNTTKLFSELGGDELGIPETESTHDAVEVDDAPAVPKPLAAAKVDAWRRYAESLGIDPKGRSKDELRSLCAQRESQS